MGGQKRRVGFQEQRLERGPADHLFQGGAFFIGQGAGYGKKEIPIQAAPGQGPIPGKTMKDAADLPCLFLVQDLQGLLMGLPVMNDYRQGNFPGQLQALAENRIL